MSLALYALIAIRLDAREGQWIRVEDLASHVGLSAQTVATACERMRSDGLLEVRRADGQAWIEAVRTPAALLHAEPQGAR